MPGVSVRRDGTFHGGNERGAGRRSAGAAGSCQHNQIRLVTAGPTAAAGHMNAVIPVLTRGQPDFDANARRG